LCTYQYESLAHLGKPEECTMSRPSLQAIRSLQNEDFSRFDFAQYLRFEWSKIGIVEELDED